MKRFSNLAGMPSPMMGALLAVLVLTLADQAPGQSASEARVSTRHFITQGQSLRTLQPRNSKALVQRAPSGARLPWKIPPRTGQPRTFGSGMALKSHPAADKGNGAMQKKPDKPGMQNINGHAHFRADKNRGKDKGKDKDLHVERPDGPVVARMDPNRSVAVVPSTVAAFLGDLTCHQITKPRDGADNLIVGYGVLVSYGGGYQYRTWGGYLVTEDVEQNWARNMDRFRDRPLFVYSESVPANPTSIDVNRWPNQKPDWVRVAITLIEWDSDTFLGLGAAGSWTRDMNSFLQDMHWGNHQQILSVSQGYPGTDFTVFGESVRARARAGSDDTQVIGLAEWFLPGDQLSKPLRCQVVPVEADFLAVSRPDAAYRNGFTATGTGSNYEGALYMARSLNRDVFRSVLPSQ